LETLKDFDLDNERQRDEFQKKTASHTQLGYVGIWLPSHWNIKR
jgi:hypothetical protein